MLTTRTYRNDNLTTLIDVRDGSNAQLDSFAYTYDANQNKTAETRTGVMAPWGWSTGTSGYDAEDRLRAWNRTDGQLTQGWNLTLEGDWQQFTQNGTPQNRTHGLAHELTAVGGTGLTYDVKGNLTQAATGHRYTWDFDNQLQGVDTSGDQVADVTFGYDALGRRVKKTASGATKIYVSDKSQEIAEYVSGAAPTSPTEKYVYGDYIDEPIWKTGTGGAVYYHANALYCVSALTNGSGTVVERYRYTPYGELTILAADGVTVRSASNYANPYTYTGRRWDSETGLYYYRARYYHPALGRFVGRDPIGNEIATTLYAYTSNAPIRLTDPAGLWGADIHQTQTEMWARIYFANAAAEWVGNGDEGVDHGDTRPTRRAGFPYHFDIPTPPVNVLRSFSADSRGGHFIAFKTESLQAVNRLECQLAFDRLGRALHPLQDYYAHGNWEPAFTLGRRTRGIHPGWYDNIAQVGTTQFIVPIRDWDDRNSTPINSLARRTMTHDHTRLAMETWIADTWWSPCPCLCWIRPAFRTTRCGGAALTPPSNFTIPAIATTGATAPLSGR